MRSHHTTLFVAATALCAFFAPDIYDDLRSVNDGQDTRISALEVASVDHDARIAALEDPAPDPGPGPVASGGLWYDFGSGAEITDQTTQPAFLPDEQPDGVGVTFYIDDVFNRTDATPDPYQVHPFGANPVGTEFRAEWTDTGGVERVSSHVIDGGTPPGPGARPTMETVGCPDEGALTASGSIDLETGTTLIEGLYISGSVEVKGPGTIRNCVIDGGLYGVRATYGEFPVVIEDCTIRGSASAGVYGSHVTLRRCVFHDHQGDAMKAVRHWLVEDCYVTDIGAEEGAHADALQMVSGSDVTVRRCFIDMPVPPPSPYKSNAAFMIQTNNGPIDDVVIEDCWLVGGNYTVYLKDKGNGHGAPTGCVLRNNRFGRAYRYGVLSSEASDAVIEGNVWDDTGELMSIND